MGFGSTFHIYLPASEKAVPENEVARLIKGRGRILVMDDEAPLRKMVGRMLDIDPEVKAIVSSGYSDDPVLSNFQEYGFKGLMPKPFESRSLSEVLHEVLQGEEE